jgi:two-component system cell cycle sensor histidine kinase/response regulator CckA
MKNTSNKLEATARLREQAEELLNKKPKKSSPQLSEAETLKLIHELEVYQIELEMQNEELVLAKEKAELAAEKHAALYDFAPSGYFTLSKDGTIIELNLCGAQMLGKDRGYLAHKALALFLTSDTKPIYTRFLENTFKSQAKESCEATLAIDGKLTASVYLTGIASENGELCFVTMVDISERKRSEEAMRNFQKLDALGLLAGGIAHDFNNLMGGIFGYIDMASEASTENKVTSYLSKAMNTIDRARALTQQLLTFAKGGAPIQQIGDLFPFVQETAQFALSGANVSCHFDVPQDLWACNFDKSQIGQVIDNLIINAQQAMPVGGTIELTARNITLAEKEHPTLKKDNYVKISVKDCGIGIQKEQRFLIRFLPQNQKGMALDWLPVIQSLNDTVAVLTSIPNKERVVLFMYICLHQWNPFRLITRKQIKRTKEAAHS